MFVKWLLSINYGLPYSQTQRNPLAGFKNEKSEIDGHKHNLCIEFWHPTFFSFFSVFMPKIPGMHLTLQTKIALHGMKSGKFRLFPDQTKPRLSNIQ